MKKGLPTATSTTILERQLRDPNAHIIITTIQKLSTLIRNLKTTKSLINMWSLSLTSATTRQFGDMHAAIIKTFKKYYLFGFTGTPIMPKTGSLTKSLFLTTDQTFGERLHTYTIVDAINDNNVLPFRVDYIKTMSMKDNIEDEDVQDINREEAFLSPERISQVTSYILDHFNQKTYRGAKYYTLSTITNVAKVASAERGKIEEIKRLQRISGFNSIFAVASIPMAKLYYEECQKQMKENPSKCIRIALIYSYGANEEEADGIIDEENPEDTRLSTRVRDFLEQAIRL